MEVAVSPSLIADKLSTMDPGTDLAAWRRRLGYTQRELASRAGVPQSTVGRIEVGLIDPRLSTLRKLFRACGADVEVAAVLGGGIDRTQIRERLRLTPRERILETADSWREMERIRGRARRSSR